MFTSHNATLNTLCDENIAAQSILLEKNVPPDRNSSFITERTSRQLSSKCKKKQGNKKTAYKCNKHILLFPLYYSYIIL